MIKTFLKERWKYLLLIIILGSFSYSLGSTIFIAFLTVLTTSFSLGWIRKSEGKRLRSRIKKLEEEVAMLKLANKELRG